MKKSFKTISKPSSTKYIEKKSVFIAHSFHVTSEAEALQHIAECKKTFWDATHNVYAYYICGESMQPAQKYSDDGEPSGTAGMPVLEAIRRLDLEDVLIVVTRYFGGVQLGAPGLVRAYGKAASLALAESQIIEKTFCNQLRISLTYSLFEKLQKILEKTSAKQVCVDYSEDVLLTLNIPIDDLDLVISSIIELSNGQVKIEQIKGTFLY